MDKRSKVISGLKGAENRKSEPMAWSFYSENAQSGQRINVDMLKAIRLVEQLSGEKLFISRILNPVK